MNLGRTLAAGTVAAALLFSAAACDSSDPVISKVVATPPWSSAEEAHYSLRYENGDLYGTCILTTVPETEPGKTQLSQLCGGDGPQHDDRRALVDSKTLRPFSATRTISDSSKSKRTIFTTTYDDAAGSVHLKADEDGKVHETNRDLPKPTSASPDPGYYDDESLFWVIRSVPLQKGWEGAYEDVNASNGQIFSARVQVQDKESVRVQSGTYTAWKVRLETNSITQYFWVDAGGNHAVVRARIERLTYELDSVR